MSRATPQPHIDEVVRNHAGLSTCSLIPKCDCAIIGLEEFLAP